MSRARIFAAAFAFIALIGACDDKAHGRRRRDDDEPGPERPSSAATSSAVLASGSGRAPIPSTLFSGAPLQLEDMRIKLGRGGDPRALDVRAVAVVTAPREGAVDIPIRMACKFGQHRVVATSEMISAERASFLLSHAGRTDAYVRSPTDMGWLGDPEGCELVFVLDPGEKANTVEARVCWNGESVALGACGFRPIAAPAARFLLHHLSFNLHHMLEIHAHVQTRDASPPPGEVVATASCAKGGKGNDSESVRPLAPFALDAGESVALSFTLFRDSEHGLGDCTVKFGWKARGEAELDLGTWCMIDDEGSSPIPPAPKEGPC